MRLGRGVERAIERAIEPFRKVTIAEQIPAQQSHKVGYRPPEIGVELQVADYQHRNQCFFFLDWMGKKV